MSICGRMVLVNGEPVWGGGGAMQQQLPLPRNLPHLPPPATTPDPPSTRVGMDSQGRMDVDKGGVVCSAVNKSTRGGGGRWARVEQARRVREAIIVAA